MPQSSIYLDTLRFGRGWLRPRSGIRLRELMIEPDDGAAPSAATLMETAGGLPSRGWVMLHGMTRPGRHHPALMRFGRALASTGGRVLIPEVPEWTALAFAPERAQAIIGAAVRRLATDPETRPGGVALVGFSFGAPQALLAVSAPDCARYVRAVIAWGGYDDLGRTAYFQFTGEHEWDGVTHHQDPDPYGRWVVGANCLPLASGLPAPDAVADALRTLAASAGDRQVDARDAGLDGLKAQLRMNLPRQARPLFDQFVPPADHTPDIDDVRRLVDHVSAAVRREAPLLEPLRMIRDIPMPVRVLHARTDHLIPFTETLRTARTLAPHTRSLKASVVGLFQHSGRPGGESVVDQVRALPGFLGAVSGIFEATRERAGGD